MERDLRDIMLEGKTADDAQLEKELQHHRDEIFRAAGHMLGAVGIIASILSVAYYKESEAKSAAEQRARIYSMAEHTFPHAQVQGYFLQDVNGDGREDISFRLYEHGQTRIETLNSAGEK